MKKRQRNGVFLRHVYFAEESSSRAWLTGGGGGGGGGGPACMEWPIIKRSLIF
jgi:hypothetical protein